MNTITSQKMNIVAKNLESIIKQAQRRLFEFETMKSTYELQQGKFKIYTSAKPLIKNAKNGR